MKGPFFAGTLPDGFTGIRDSSGTTVARVPKASDAEILTEYLNRGWEHRPVDEPLEAVGRCSKHNLPTYEYNCPYDEDVNNKQTLVVGCATCYHEACMDI